MKYLAICVLAGSMIASEAIPRVRNFHLEYQVVLKDIPAQSKHVDVWLPVPHDDPYQQITNLKIESPMKYEITSAPDGNRMLHAALGGATATPLTISIALDAAREEHVQPKLFHEESKTELAKYLKPDRLVPIDGQIREWAWDVVQKAGANTDFEMARAIYNHVVATVKYDKTGKGWGRGDIYYACEARRGNCTDFHAIFIGYARALGIPARFAIGLPLPLDRGQGKIAGYHCWAEFYAKGIGWVPVDASEAAKNPQKREYFFGTHDENRIELSKGRDVTLAPVQKGEPLNYFVYPYVEVDGSPLTGTVLEVSYRDKDATAPRP